MSHTNTISLDSSLILLIICINIIPLIISFPFINLQSAELKNGNYLMVHQYGVDICDKDLKQVLRKEVVFSAEERISTPQKMQYVIIKSFEDGYLVCLIINKVYIFDDVGQLLSKIEGINHNKTVNYYTLDIKDSYHFYIGFMADSLLNLYYYEFDPTTNKTSLKGESGAITSKENWLWVFNTEYTFQDKGLDCQFMYHKVKGETLACFFITSNSNKYYWNVEFLYENFGIFNSQPNYTYIRKEMPQTVSNLFKVEVNSNKTRALICSFDNNNLDFCFNYTTDQSDLFLDYKTPGGDTCLPQYYAFKVNYFAERDEFVFSCLGYYDNIKYVVYKFENDTSVTYNSFALSENDRCDNFNGYSIFYSKEEEKYYITNDYLCNKTIIKPITTIPMTEEETIKEEEKVQTTIEVTQAEEYNCSLEKCSKCDEISESQNLCTTCNELKGYYPLKMTFKTNNNYKECINDTSKPINYFFNRLEKCYESCFETCKKCEYGGDNINNNCTECEVGYIFIPGLTNTFNCYLKCQYYFYFTIYGQYKCTSLAICPEDYHLLLKNKSQCIEDCTLDAEYKYQYNGECYKECPNNSSDNNDYICLDNNIEKCSLSKRELIVNNELVTEQDIEQLAKSYVKEFFYTDNHISLFNYGNHEIALYKNFECISDLSLEIPSVDLGKCYKKVQTKYDIEENLILGILSQRKEDTKYPVIISFYVYSPYTGSELNITSACENEGLNIKEDISMKMEDKEKYEYVQFLSQQNIDVFNLSSDFYSDICYYFDSPIKKDIALKDRIKIFFPNITLCENGCNIKAINSSTMKAECECKLSNLLSKGSLANNAFYKSQVGEIEEMLSQSNLEILKCGTELFKHRNISTYYGSFIILSFIASQIGLSLFYFLGSIAPLKKYLYDILNSFLFLKGKKGNDPPKKTTPAKQVKFVKTPKEEKKDKNIKKKGKRINTENLHVLNSSRKEKIVTRKDLISSNSKKTKTINHNSKDKDISVFPSSHKELKIKDIKKTELIDKDYEIKLPPKDEINFDIEDYLKTDFESMPFEEIIYEDHRTFSEYFKEQLKSNLLILNIIFCNEPLKPRAIKIILYIINIDLYLFVNALFINEEFISEVYHSDKNNFFSFLSRSLDRVFYTTLVKVVVGYLIDCFFIEEKKIKIILKSKRNTKQDVKNKIKEILDGALKRFIIFIILSFLITLFSLYYITCFNYRYYYITNEWIKSSVFIIIIMEILSILVILIESILRFISLKLNSEKIYKLSLFFA